MTNVLERSQKTHNLRREGGFIRFSLTSDGTPQKNWLQRLERADCTADVFPRFATTDNRVYDGTLLTRRQVRHQFNLIQQRNVAAAQMVNDLHECEIELAFLFRESFTDEQIAEMDVSRVIFMHRPIITNASPFQRWLCIDLTKKRNCLTYTIPFNTFFKANSGFVFLLG